MKGPVILFRGSGAEARRYLESDRSLADDYYLEAGTAIAEFSAMNAAGEVVGEVGLTPDEYASWVNWVDPLTGESMGKPRLAGEAKQGSPRLAEMVVNSPKSLSVAAALYPEVSEALDAAQKDAVAEIRSWLGQHSVTRIGPRGKQEVVPVEQLETVSVVHHTSRAGDPHRHIHFQIGARVWAAGAWRGLDTGALFRQQGAIRALGTAVIAAHPQLAAGLDKHGLTLDPVTGEVAELEPYNALMSKRSAQVQRNLARFEKDWRAAHPGEEPGPVVRGRLEAMAWDHERPSKKPATLSDEAAWRVELEQAGYRPDPPRVRRRAAVSLDDLSVQQVASRALDRCAAGASTWTRHTVREHLTRIITEAGVRATPEALRDMVAITTALAVEDCLSVLPPDMVQPDHVAHLTSLHVVAVETQLRDMLQARATVGASRVPDVTRLARRRGLEPEQAQAAAAVAGTDPLVVVEGAAGVDVHGEAGETWGRGRIFGIVPLPDDRVYWFATESTTAGQRAQDERDAVRERFGDWHPPILACIDATPADAVLRHDIYDLARLPATLVKGRTVLLGDAAHGMTPNLGHGAGQAIEDAATLTLLLRHGDLHAALSRYDELRRKRTKAFWRQSRQMGRVAQASHPIVAGIRDALLRATPPAFMGRATQSIQRWNEP